MRLAVGDLRIGFLAFDATGVGLVAGSAPGVMAWDPVTSADTISVLANDADLTIVSVHGGAEYLPVNDPQMVEIAEAAAAAGADVVWGHGAHVIQPVMTLVGDRPTVAATSLGNFLFDQAGPDRTTGAALELLADRDGIIAYRVAITRHPDRRVEFVEWQAPEGPAGWLDDAWWSVIRPLQPAPTTATLVSTFPHGDLIAAARGDITGDGSVDVVASFRRPHKVTPFSSLHPEIRWQDRLGRSAHVGVYDPDDLDEVWVAGTVLMPVSAIEACDRSIAIVHNSLDDSTPIATSAWAWNGFGFDTGPELAGPGQPRCADLDGDGLTRTLDSEGPVSRLTSLLRSAAQWIYSDRKRQRREGRSIMFKPGVALLVLVIAAAACTSTPESADGDQPTTTAGPTTTAAETLIPEPGLRSAVSRP